jgi:hypothetical protein
LLHQPLSGNFGYLWSGNFVNALPNFAAEFNTIAAFHDRWLRGTPPLCHYPYVGRKPAAARAHR